MTTLAEARLLITEIIETAWLADALSLPIPLFWDNVETETPIPSGSDPDGRALPYARVTVRNISDKATTLGPSGNRRFLAEAIVTTQIFVPFGDGWQQAGALAEIVKTALRTSSSINSVCVLRN